MTPENLAASYTPRPGKFIVPSRLPDLLRRQRLLDFLHENIHRKLILIAAAAGYGKSSLLIDFAHDTDYRIAWYQLDDGDADLAALAAGLAAALKRLYPTFESVLPSLAARPGADPSDLATALNRELAAALDEYCVIVLDDFHLIEHAPQITSFFDALLGGLPEQAHLIISSRTLPPIRVVSLAARQQVAGLNEERLRFTTDEVKALVAAQSRLVLAGAEAEKLASVSEGWITGILLSAELISQGVMSGLLPTRSGDTPVYDFLADEVLEKAPEPLRRFLMESAVLPDMDPAACDAVLGRSDSDRMLREVESRHLFVSAVGDEFRSYHYHHLFRQFLLSRLRAQAPERLGELQTRAAQMYAANNMPEAAVTFYVAAGQTAEAARVAEQCAQVMFVSGRLTTLQRWVEQLAPVADHAPHVHLYLAKLQGALDQGLAEKALQTARDSFLRRGDSQGCLSADMVRAWWAYERGEIASAVQIASECLIQARELELPEQVAAVLRQLGLCHISLENFDAAEDALREARQMLADTPHHYDLALILTDLANVLRIRGRTADAAQIQQKALAAWRQIGTPLQLAVVLNNIAFDLHMLAQYENALATYRESLDWAHKAGSARMESTILAGQGDMFTDLGDGAQAAELYRQALSKAEKADNRALMAYLYRAVARLHRAAGSFTAALEWLRRAELASGKLPTPLASTEGLHGIILVETGRVAEGRQALERACAGLEKTSGWVDLAQALFFCAAAQFRDGDAEAAAASLARALKLVEEIGYDQMLVAEALPVRDMLETFASDPDIGPPARSLLTRAEQLKKARSRVLQAPAASSPVQPATIEVLALGSSRIFKDGVEIPKIAWKYQRLREVLLFIVDRAPVQRNAVLEAFWPDRPRMRASASLRQSLYLVRRALGCDIIIIDVVEDEYRLASDVSINYDVSRFETNARQAQALAEGDLRRLDALAAAGTLYTGEYAADVAAEWARERRRALGELAVLVFRAYVDELMNLTRYAEARSVLERALVFEPLRDDLHMRMLNCLARMGLRHEVVSHYLKYQDSLRVELGLDPPPEMRELYSRLIA